MFVFFFNLRVVLIIYQVFYLRINFIVSQLKIQPSIWQKLHYISYIIIMICNCTTVFILIIILLFLDDFRFAFIVECKVKKKLLDLE